MTTLYLPLGANARSLLVGQPQRRFDAALKFWSLWHDRLILEDGVWLGRSGPKGPYETHIDTDPALDWDLQTPHARSAPHRPRGQQGPIAHAEDGTELYAQKSGLPGQSVYHLVSPDETIAWEATFRPWKVTLPPQALEFIKFQFPDQIDRETLDAAVADFAADDLVDPKLRLRTEADGQLVIQNVARALIRSTALGATVRLDPLHQRVVAARHRRGQARRELGEDGLRFLFPNVAEQPWEVIAQLRDVPGLKELRTVISETETLAREAAAADSRLEIAIIRQMNHRIAEVAESLIPDLRDVIRDQALTAGVALLTGGLSIPLQVLAATALEAAQHGVGAKHAWVTAFYRLSSLTNQ